MVMETEEEEEEVVVVVVVVLVVVVVVAVVVGGGNDGTGEYTNTSTHTQYLQIHFVPLSTHTPLKKTEQLMLQREIITWEPYKSHTYNL